VGNGVEAPIRKVQATNKTSQNMRLHARNVCGCELKVKVLVPEEAIDNRGLEYPEWCWQREPSSDVLQVERDDQDEQV
jgi:hypothetical protein